jgi:hypothetical protein
MREEKTIGELEFCKAEDCQASSGCSGRGSTGSVFPTDIRVRKNGDKLVAVCTWYRKTKK